MEIVIVLTEMEIFLIIHFFITIQSSEYIGKAYIESTDAIP